MAANPVHQKVNYLVFSASLRADSLNTKLARLAARIIEQHGGTVDLASMSEFDAPSYNQDIQDTVGFPPGAAEFRRRLEANDAFVIASPEYNGSMPGPLKNAIDWVSRYNPQPFKGRRGQLLSASPSLAGGNHGLWALRVPLEYLSARLLPDMFSLAQANQAFGPDGRILDPQLQERLEGNITTFMGLVEAGKFYPETKEALAEALAEQRVR